MRYGFIDKPFKTIHLRNSNWQITFEPKQSFWNLNNHLEEWKISENNKKKTNIWPFCLHSSITLNDVWTHIFARLNFLASY